MSLPTKRNPELQRKIDVLLQMEQDTPVGETLTFQAMCGRLNEPVTSQHPAMYRSLAKAKNLGMVFVNEPGVGYRRLSDNETATTGMTIHRKKLFRGAKRGIKTAQTVKDLSRLTSTEKNLLWASQNLFQTIKTTAHGNAVRAKAAKPPSALDAVMERMSAKK